MWAKSPSNSAAGWHEVRVRRERDQARIPPDQGSTHNLPNPCGPSHVTGDTRPVDSIYRSTTGKELIRRWCLDQLAAWPVPHEQKTVTAKGAQTHVVLAGSGATTVVFVPGTNFNAAASLPLATALVTTGYRVLLADVPGQPGLSSGERGLSGGRLSWYGEWLSEVIEKISSEPVAVMGHSFGAAIALSSDSPRVDRLVLVSPGGLTRLRLTPAVLACA